MRLPKDVGRVGEYVHPGVFFDPERESRLSLSGEGEAELRGREDELMKREPLYFHIPILGPPSSAPAPESSGSPTSLSSTPSNGNGNGNGNGTIPDVCKESTPL